LRTALGLFSRAKGERLRTSARWSGFRKLDFDVLESRIAPAVTSSFNAGTGLLAVASNAGDAIALAVDVGNTVTINGSNVLGSGGPAAAASVKTIQITGGGGNNVID